MSGGIADDALEGCAPDFIGRPASADLLAIGELASMADWLLCRHGYSSL
jgi:hypothetical protein